MLIATQGVRAIVRTGQFSKVQTALETGGGDGSFTFSRYREWLEKRKDWYTPSQSDLQEASRRPRTRSTSRCRSPAAREIAPGQASAWSSAQLLPPRTIRKRRCKMKMASSRSKPMTISRAFFPSWKIDEER